MLIVPVMIWLTARYGSVSARELLGALWRPMLAASLMAAMVHVLPWTFFEPALIRLVAKGSLCTLTYPALIWVLWVASGRPAGIEATAIEQVRLLRNRQTARS